MSQTGQFDPAGVPVIFPASAFTDVLGIYNQSFAQVSFDFSSWRACSGLCFGVAPVSSFDISETILLNPERSSTGAISHIRLVTSADTNSPGPTSFAYAFADPMVRIDPAYASSHPQHALAFSSNLPVDAFSPVPEPGTWLLMSLGFAAIARRSTVRRRYAAGLTETR